MFDFKNMSFDELLKPDGYDCICGRHHATGVKYLKIGRGAVKAIPEMLAALRVSHPFVVCDQNTYKAAGEQVVQILKASGIPYALYVFGHEHPVLPSERELGILAMRFDHQCDVVLGVGSGVINDLCKMLGWIAKRPCAIVGTAPSMDGYASNSSAMELEGVKLTIYNNGPEGVICDTEIMAQAPMRMLRAGFGDMIAKYISICEWRIANLVTGEYYCEAIADMMRTAVSKIMASVDGILARDPDAVGYVAEGLVLSGLAMAYANVSRPASGIEHRFSHIWEMINIARGRTLELHGIQVGVGTMLTLELYEYIKRIKPDLTHAKAAIAAFDNTAWEAKIRRIFGAVADEIFASVKKSRQNDSEIRLAHAEYICAHWNDILAIIQAELPDIDTIYEAAKKLGMPVRPGEIGISAEDTMDALVCTQDIRDRYICTSLLFDLGLLDDAAIFFKKFLN